MRTPLWLAGLSLWLMAGMGLEARGQAQGQPAPEDKTGLPIGAPAPDFTLKDQDGKEVSLSDLRKKGPVALVFYRSADW